MKDAIDNPRIAVVHSYYSGSQPSGENRVVNDQVAALSDMGLEVRLFARHTDEAATSHVYPLKAAWTVASGEGHTPEGLRDFNPDIVHVHNLFPNFGRRWLLRWGGPVVATLHNFRPICPKATLYRNGRLCDDCLQQGSAWPSVAHGCYQASRMKTLPLALGTRFAEDPVLTRCDRVIVLNRRMRNVYEEAGVMSSKLVTVSNFLPDPPSQVSSRRNEDYWLFVGRLSPEKGIRQLLDHWPTDERLLIAGAGELDHEIRRLRHPSVSSLGLLPQGEVRKKLQGATGLVFPSQWYEGFPMVYLEAISVGTPVVAWEPNMVAGLVQEDGTGTIASWENLRSALASIRRGGQTLRHQCRSTFTEKYTAEAWGNATREVYRHVLVTREGS